MTVTAVVCLLLVRDDTQRRTRECQLCRGRRGWRAVAHRAEVTPTPEARSAGAAAAIVDILSTCLFAHNGMNAARRAEQSLETVDGGSLWQVLLLPLRQACTWGRCRRPSHTQS